MLALTPCCLEIDLLIRVAHPQFDNQQKQMGKPTSDELKQQEVREAGEFAALTLLTDSVFPPTLTRPQILKKFQADHPEMDFSQAKIGGADGSFAFPGQ